MAASAAKKILVVSAHVADWCTRSGGTLLKYLQEGCQVLVLALTFGERGESPEYWAKHPGSTVEDCKACRREEAVAAADHCGVGIQFLDYNDYPLVMDAERIKDLTRRILEYRPDVILTHSPGDPLNVDHEETYRAVIRAASSAGMLGALPNTPAHFIPDIFLFESSLPHSEFNGFQMDTYVDITSVMDQKLEAIACFASQPQLPDYYTRCGARRGEQATNWMRGRQSIPCAEGFRRYTPFVGQLLPTIDL
ncbi:hypothetical protein CE91St41_33490 [Oscillospiraceae bacterium]|nr:hypothetical protein CE91St40_33480 [Oscillospiraceae bacterium]BDF76460.1 hypothetical protein CE91St41_33490 [Oscillospiraceae bacterium]